jgi:hypothetical protein
LVCQQTEEEECFSHRPKLQDAFREAEFDTDGRIEFRHFIPQPVAKLTARYHREVFVIRWRRQNVVSDQSSHALCF